MNSEELKKYRKNFYKNLEKYLNTKSLDEIIEISMLETKIENENTNRIMVCIGTYIEEKEGLKKVEYLTYNANYKAKYRLYMDIESQYIYRVSYDQIQEFEKQYAVVYLPIEVCNVQEYNKKYMELRRKFFKDLLYNHQDDSVLKLKNNNLN